MSTTKIIIPFADNKDNPLPDLFNILISFNNFSMQDDVPNKVNKFRSGQDLSFDILTENLPDVLWHLKDRGFMFKPDNLNLLIPTYKVKLHLYTAYRVLKTTWGIAIDINGTSEEVNSAKNTIAISDKKLRRDEREQIERGLQSLFSEKLNMDKNYSIEIQKVDFNPCDYQIDGLYWASRDWLSKALKVKITEPEISYDKTSNKYFFSL